MTYEEVVENALARTLDFDGQFPSSRLPMYRRVGKRQQQLMSMASKVSPDYHGACATGVLDVNGCLDLRDLETATNLDQAGVIQRFEISDPGTSVFPTGTQVHLVSRDDVKAGIAPRATLRDRFIKGVALDLDGVVSIDVWYGRIADMPLAAEDGTTDLEMHETHQELLIIDLTKDLVRKALELSPEAKGAILAILETEEQAALADYTNDVAAFASAQEKRFSEPPPTATR